MNAFTIQMEDPKAGSASFEERFAALVDIEYTTRKSNTLKRLIKTAAFEQPSAHIADIDYKSGPLNQSNPCRAVSVTIPAAFYSARGMAVSFFPRS